MLTQPSVNNQEWKSHTLQGLGFISLEFRGLGFRGSGLRVPNLAALATRVSENPINATTWALVSMQGVAPLPKK